MQHQPLERSSEFGVWQAVVGQWAHEDRVRASQIRAEHIGEHLIADHCHAVRLELHFLHGGAKGSGKGLTSGATTADGGNLEDLREMRDPARQGVADETQLNASNSQRLEPIAQGWHVAEFAVWHERVVNVQHQALQSSSLHKRWSDELHALEEFSGEQHAHSACFTTCDGSSRWFSPLPDVGEAAAKRRVRGASASELPLTSHVKSDSSLVALEGVKW